MKLFSDNQELRTLLLNGINKLADNVATTLGPKGKTVILRPKDGKAIITKDGVTVSKFVDLEDPIENLGAQLLKQAAQETNNVAGDGTTTSTVLARAIVKNTQKYLIEESISPVELKKGMEKAMVSVFHDLDLMTKKLKSLKDIENIATISTNGDRIIGKLIAEAVDKAGKDGAITIQENKTNTTSLELKEGFMFQGGWHASAFINVKDRGSMTHENALIFITDIPLTKVTQMVSVLHIAARTPTKPLIIIAPEVYDQALTALIWNLEAGKMTVGSIKPGYFGNETRSLLEDLAAVTGAKYFTLHNTEFEADGQIKISPGDLGRCDKIEAYKNYCNILNGQGEQQKIADRIDQLKVEIKHTDDLQEAERIQQRITRLSSGVAVINLGGYSDVEIIEKKHRVIDALEAVKAAQKDGIIPGGGVALLRAAKAAKTTAIDESQLLTLEQMQAKSKHEGFELPADEHLRENLVVLENEDQKTGFNIVIEACSSPVKQIAKNAGQSADLIIATILSSPDVDMGYNFANDKYENFFEVGIVDPLMVTKTALRNAISVASTILTTNYAIVEV